MTAAAEKTLQFHLGADKVSTSFTWDLADWSILEDYYLSNHVESPKIVLSNGVTCKLMLLELVRGAPLVGFEPEWDPLHLNDGKIGMIDLLSGIGFERRPYLTIRVTFEIPQSLHVRASKLTVSYVDKYMTKLLTTDIWNRKGITKHTDIVLQCVNNNFEWYLRNDTLTIFCEIIIVDDIKDCLVGANIQNDNFSSDICKKFRDMYVTKELFDVTFVIGENEVSAHKSVLTLNSDVFKAMFDSDMTEKKDSVVHITDIKFDVFNSFLKYMYGGTVDKIKDIVEDLIIAADKYQVKGLKFLCEQFMFRNLNKKNASVYLTIAKKLGCEELKKKAAEYDDIS